jgi:hypothetical protein
VIRIGSADRRRRDPGDAERGLSTLLSLVAAITVVTIAFAGTMVIVEDAFRETRRGDAERAVAIQASDRLVAAGGSIGEAPNVVNVSELAALSAADLRQIGASDRFAMAVAVDGTRVPSGTRERATSSGGSRSCSPASGPNARRRSSAATIPR